MKWPAHGPLGFIMDKGTDEYSATRLAFLVWVLGVFLVWVLASVRTSSLQAIPESVLTLVGILAGGKAVQRFGERP
jgi:hypothetical protein